MLSISGSNKHFVRNRRPFIAAVIIGIILLTTASSAVAQSSGRPVAGVVVDRRNGQPIADAVVAVESATASATTSRAGRFALVAPQAGPLVLTVTAPGYVRAELRDPAATPDGDFRIELDPTPNFMERVQVTAAKSEQTIGDLAGLADVVDRSTIDVRNDQTLTQAVANVPGLVVTTQAGSFESVTLRGMPREGNEFTNTLLLIDGVPQVDSRNSARVVALPITDARAIEVLRGPNSALYGRTAIGGSVQVRTADPTPAPQLRVDLTGGEFGMFKGFAAASGPMSKRAGYYVSAMRDHNDGFYDSFTEFNVDKTAFFGKLTFVPDSQSFASVSANRVIADDSTPTSEPIVDGTFLSTLDPQYRPPGQLQPARPQLSPGRNARHAQLPAPVHAVAESRRGIRLPPHPVQVPARRRRDWLAVRHREHDVHPVPVPAADR